MTDKNEKDNPIAQLRKRYFQRRQKSKLTQTDKDALRKHKEEQDKKNTPERKIARGGDQEAGV